MVRSHKPIRHPKFAWLRRHVCPWEFFLAPAGEGPRHRYSNKFVLYSYNDCHQAPYGYRNQVLRDWACEATSSILYYGCQVSARNPRILVLIDIDVQKAGGLGSTQGARDFANHLRDTVFPNLYIEPSTHGRGIHGYVVVDCRIDSPHNPTDRQPNYWAATVNRQLILLEERLQQIATEGGFDIEQVEIMGLVNEMSWSNGRLVEIHKRHALAKVPAGLVTRFEELRNTTVLTVEALKQLTGPT